MPDVSTVSVSLTCAVPLMLGAPLAGLLATVTASVAALVTDSSLPASSVKLNLTLMVLPCTLAESA